MNCERNICYQQDYNGGCDTCPCNDELQGCNEENGQSMTTKEIIEQLKSLKSHCEDFREEDSVWAKDVEALDKAIEAMEKQATSEWIPCDKHLPEDENEVLITVNGKFNNITFDNAVEKGFYCEDDGWIIDGYLDWITPEVTAWMSLPEPYKGGIKMITDYEQILISALRYALGRRTYIVEITCKYIEKRIPILSKECKSVMIEDIEEQEEFGYGDECDKEDWMRLLKRLKERK